MSEAGSLSLNHMNRVLYSAINTITSSRTMVPPNTYKIHILALSILRHGVKELSDGVFS